MKRLEPSIPASIFLLLVAILFAYAPTFRNGFVWDDNRYITQNPAMVAPDGLIKIWSDISALPSPYPLTVSFFYAQYQMWELSAGAFHAVSLFMHFATVLGFYALLLRLRVRAAWLAALLFAVHPVQVETVAWISEQKNILSTLLGLGFLHAWLSHQRTGRWEMHGAAIACFVLALLAKTVTQTFVGTAMILWLLDRSRGEVRPEITSWRAFGLRMIPFVVLSIVFAAASIIWEREQTGATAEAVQLTALGRLNIAARVPWFYLLKGIWPMDIMAIYPRWETTDFGVTQIAFMIGTCAVVAWAAWGSLVRANPCALAAAHFLGSIAPVMGFFNYSTMIHSFTADHYQYVAAAGWMLLLAWLLDALLARVPKEFAVGKQAVLGVVIAFVILTSHAETLHYRTLESLFERNLKKNPLAWNAHYNVAHDLNMQDRLEEALPHYEECLQLKPDFEDAVNGIGVIQLKMGDFISAEQSFRRAVEINPDYGDAERNLIASLLMQAEKNLSVGNLNEADAQIANALGVDESSVDALYYLGQLRLKQGRGAEAITALERAAQLAPEDDGIAALLNQAHATTP